MTVHQRNWVFGLAAIAIVGMTVYRLQRPESATVHVSSQSVSFGPAPSANLTDSAGRPAKLQRYYGRTRLVICFFDGELGADRDPLMQKLAQAERMLADKGIQVVGVSLATPYANRQAAARRGEAFPFPLLSDIDPGGQVAMAHRAWGAIDRQTEGTQRGLYLVERDGTTAFRNGAPCLVTEEIGQRLLEGGLWPERGDWENSAAVSGGAGK